MDAVSKLKRRSKRYFKKMRISDTEVRERVEISVETEISLIALLNRMNSEYRKSFYDFLENYGDFSDRLNKIYNTAERGVFGGIESPYAENFSSLQRKDFAKLLPTTYANLKAIENVAGEAAVLAWLFSPARAERAALNNTNSLFACSQFEKIKRQGYKYKVWKTIIDGRERHSHLVANGQTVPVEQPFIVGGYRMMFPRDTTYGAPAKEIMNCRCSVMGK